MFAQICLIVGAWVAGDVTLSNGIRVIELPASGDSFEIVAGYQVGNHPFASIVSTFLLSTNSARAIAVAAYGAGGRIELISDPDRIAIRVTGPIWAKPSIESELAKFFEETPQKNPELAARAVALARSRPVPDFRAQVEQELRVTVLGDSPDFQDFNFETDRALVLMSSPVAINGLGDIAARRSMGRTGSIPPQAQGGRAFRYKPDLPAGAVILASPVPAVYYEGWYAALLLDRLIQQVIPGVTSSIGPGLDGYYYRLEASVPEGQFDDIVEASLIEDLQQLELTRPTPEDLEAARASAIAYLGEEQIQKWFQGFGLDSRRLEGLDRLRAFTADDVRAAARDFLAARVVASWSPKPRQLSVDIESLDAPQPDVATADAPELLGELSEVPIQAFPPHRHVFTKDVPPERLGSGVSVVSSSKHAIFVAPQTLNILDHELDANEMKAYESFRPQRILVMTPPASLTRVKEQWSAFKGNPEDTRQVTSIGAVANVDLPALLILKMMLDRRLIEGGLWNDVQLQITAAEGSQLSIQGDDAARRRVLTWINEFAANAPSSEELEWGIEAGVHHLDSIKPDLQGLIWQRDRQGIFSDLTSVTETQVQDVARIYFQ